MKVFNTGLNKFYRRYLLENFSEDETLLATTFEEEYKKALADIVEQLLFFDKVSIKVYGENLALTVLLNELGLKQFLDLVDEGAIEFVLWTPILTTLSNDDPNLMGKINPIQSGNVNSPVHCDPNESIKVGIKALRNQPDRNVRRDIEKKVAKIYNIPKIEFAHNAANIVSSAYDSDKLSEFGLPKTKELAWLNKDERFKLLDVGESILETAILADLKCVSLNQYIYYAITRKSFELIKKAEKIISAVDEIYKIEKLPDVKELITAGKIDLKKLIKLRHKSVSRKFRKWLVNHANEDNDNDYVIKEYINEIAGHKGLLEAGPGKFVKTMGVYGIGIGAGTVIGGIPGTVISAASGKILENIVDLGLSFIDGYLLDGLLKGWQPRFFINEFEKITNSIDENI